jgi:hypothetical protein
VHACCGGSDTSGTRHSQTLLTLVADSDVQACFASSMNIHKLRRREVRPIERLRTGFRAVFALRVRDLRGNECHRTDKVAGPGFDRSRQCRQGLPVRAARESAVPFPGRSRRWPADYALWPTNAPATARRISHSKRTRTTNCAGIQDSQSCRERPGPRRHRNTSGMAQFGMRSTNSQMDSPANGRIVAVTNPHTAI